MLEYRFVLSFILITLVFFGCSPKPVSVEGTAMLPTFHNGDKILTDENIGELERGDIITFLYPKDPSKWYFKRVIGLPGETIEIRAGEVFINGQKLEESYVDKRFNQSAPSFPPKLIEENHFYVLGDNRDNSSDSRYWGTVDKKLIKGKYTMTYSKAGQ